MKITVLDAYKAMYAFIRGYFLKNGKPDDIAVLLGAMSLSTRKNPYAFTVESQGYEPLDRALWQDWLEATDTIIPEKINETPRCFSAIEAYKAVYLFIQTWYEIGQKSEEPFGILMEKMALWENEKPLSIDEWLPNGGTPKDPTMWAEWLETIDSVTEKQRD